MPRLAFCCLALFALEGCTVALPSLWERTNTAPPLTAQMAQPAGDPRTTGSVNRGATATAPAAGGALPIPQADWDAAKAVLMQALADNADTPSLPWTNAASGMGGTVTAMQRANGPSGQTCRDFLGSAIKDGRETWFDGRACRSTGPWAVTELRPWRRS
ncbi:RT0821/Lpp0805 family surface protein [Phreatobacter sp.]|uniref:RT0821/Lpp0805 family surface protein n=1 Tax=Phreatobacter sp. TaxID=1966341 RepID=UPI003F70FA1B